MNTLIHADIFFFVTTIALILVTIGLLIALVYVILILRNVRDVSDRVRKESEGIAEDIHALRAEIRGGTFTAGAFFGFIKKLFARGKKKPTSHNHHTHEEHTE